MKKRNHLPRFLLVGFLFLLLSHPAHAQQLISSAGNTVTKNNLTMSWSLGELAIQTFDAGDLILTQGFHQPYTLATGISGIENILGLKVYPNPTADFLHVETADAHDLSFKLINAVGAVLMIKESVSNPEVLSVEPFPSGIYYLNVYKHQQLVNSFKISIIR